MLAAMLPLLTALIISIIEFSEPISSGLYTSARDCSKFVSHESPCGNPLRLLSQTLETVTREQPRAKMY